MIPMPLVQQYQQQQQQQNNPDLTDRDEVKKLIVQRKRNNLEQLDDALGDALMGFGSSSLKAVNEHEAEEKRLEIDFAAAAASKRSKRTKKAKIKGLSASTIAAQNMTQVHQDEDFIYPSLDFSDDEEGPKKVNDSKDGAWNPKAKVKYDKSKRERIPRDNAKKIQVERGLQLAAKRLAAAKSAKRKAAKKNSNSSNNTKDSVDIKPVVPPKPQLVTAPSLDDDGLFTAAPSLKKVLPTSLAIKTRPVHVESSTSTNSASSSSVSRPRKGMATAKQRLGKKLKLKF